MQNSTTSTPKSSNSQVKPDQFLVCGLGSLGQYCVLALKQFGVNVIAIEKTEPQNWEIPHLPEFLEQLIIGDCRQINLLEQAKIKQCRAALIVTTNEQINAETALIIRQLNPYTRLIIRSAQENLNQLLGEYLGNFIAYEPTQLPVNAFALAALDSETMGFFSLDGEKVRIIQRQITAENPWCNLRRLHELNTRTRRLLVHSNHLHPLSPSFHQWQPEHLISPGDTIVYIETAHQFLFTSTSASEKLGQLPQKKVSNFLKYIPKKLIRFWHFNIHQPVRRVALFCGLIVLFLLIFSTILLHLSYPNTTLLSAFSATAILLLGGYSDLFGEIEQIDDIPAWLQLYSLGLTIAGIAFVGVLYALVTQALLSAKFQFLKNRPPVPSHNHIVIIGLGRIGQQLVALLQELKQSVVGVSLKLDIDRNILPEIPLIVGNIKEVFSQANIETAKSVVIVNNNEILNLEVALMSKKINPHSRLVIRTFGESISKSLSQLLPNSQVLGTYGLAAQAFAGAAFGENILNLCSFKDEIILVTEYHIEAEDTLEGLLLSEVAYGYGVVPILHQKPLNSSQFMPSDDIRLSVGDRMVILATIKGLQRIEKGQINTNSKCWQVRIEQTLTADAIFEGANVLARISGCSLHIARELMNHLPATLPTLLYKYQAMRLVRTLNKIRVKARIINLEERQSHCQEVS